jgi:tryptophan synthase alpha chain
MIKTVRKRTDIPLLFMTYINPVFTYEKNRFMKRCKECGVDGVIVPDMPFEENYELKDQCERHGISLISMIAPTSGKRTLRIADKAEGFLYCVSSLGVTGVRSKIDTKIADSIKLVKTVSSIPCAVGFGISTPEQVREMVKIADGVIVGSAIVKLIARHGKDSVEPVKKFVKELRYECV